MLANPTAFWKSIQYQFDPIVVPEPVLMRILHPQCFSRVSSSQCQYQGGPPLRIVQQMMRIDTCGLALASVLKVKEAYQLGVPSSTVSETVSFLSIAR